MADWFDGDLLRAALAAARSRLASLGLRGCDVEEVALLIVEGIWRKVDRGELAVSSLIGLATSRAKHALLDWRRQQARHPRPVGLVERFELLEEAGLVVVGISGTSSESGTCSADSEEAIFELQPRLTGVDRLLLSLRYVNGLGVAQAAQAAGMTLDQAKKRFAKIWRLRHRATAAERPPGSPKKQTTNRRR